MTTHPTLVVKAAHFVDEAVGVAQIVERHAFGDLEAQQVDDIAGFGKHGESVLNESFVIERGTAQVKANEACLGQAGAGLGQPLQQRPKHPTVDQRDAAIAFGGADDSAGGGGGAVGFAQPQQNCYLPNIILTDKK